MLVVMIVIIVVAVAVLAGVVSYNRLVRLRNRVSSAWSQITVQLTRRHDLIPNLVETVKGYAAHERQTLEAVIQARNTAVVAQQAGPASRAQAENVLTGALRQLFALSEAYWISGRTTPS
jgi:LemA protein